MIPVRNAHKTLSALVNTKAIKLNNESNIFWFPSPLWGG